MIKKLISVLLIFSIIFGSVGVVSASAAETETNEEESLTDIMYVGQIRRLLFVYDNEVLSSRKVKWSITTGKDVVEIVDNKSVKALKAGSATVVGQYKGEKNSYTVLVMNKPECKARKVTVGTGTVKIPSGYMEAYNGDASLTLNSIKSDNMLSIFYVDKDDLSPEFSLDDDGKVKIYLETVLETMISTILEAYETFGITDSKFESKELEAGKVRYKGCIKLKNIGKYYIDGVAIYNENEGAKVALDIGYEKKEASKIISYIAKKN